MIGTQAKENSCLMGWRKSWNIDEESEVFCYKNASGNKVCKVSSKCIHVSSYIVYTTTSLFVYRELKGNAG